MQTETWLGCYKNNTFIMDFYERLYLSRPGFKFYFYHCRGIPKKYFGKSSVSHPEKVRFRY